MGEIGVGCSGRDGEGAVGRAGDFNLVTGGLGVDGGELASESRGRANGFVSDGDGHGRGGELTDAHDDRTGDEVGGGSGGASEESDGRGADEIGLHLDEGSENGSGSDEEGAALPDCFALGGGEG